VGQFSPDQYEKWYTYKFTSTLILVYLYTLKNYLIILNKINCLEVYFFLRVCNRYFLFGNKTCAIWARKCRVDAYELLFYVILQ